jgi:anti-sigma B factor antagonist
MNAADGDFAVSLGEERDRMDLSVSSHGTIPILRVDGDVDMASAPELAAAVDLHSAGYRSPLLIDLSECLFMDSGGLNVLLQAVRQLDGQAWLGVIGTNRNLRRVFDIVGLTTDSRFRVLEDLSDLRE